MTNKDRKHILSEAKKKILAIAYDMQESSPLVDTLNKDNLALKARAASAVNHLRLAVIEIEELEKKLGLT